MSETEETKYGWAWAKVNCDFTNSMGILTHYNSNKMYELGADGVTPDDEASKHFVFASSEPELQKAVAVYKAENNLI